MKKRLFFFPLLLLWAVLCDAQQLVVQSFRLDDTDLTANTTGTTMLDQNGQKCALIKVETSQQGFSFDAGTLGVVKTEQHVGEIWVYVPEGVKRITISHQQLGILRDYDLGQTLKRAKTYILKLTSGEVQTIVKRNRTSQYVVFQVYPKDAVVMLDNEMLQTVDGTATKVLRFGNYDYRVYAPGYLTEIGKVIVNDPKQKHVVNVSLKPNFSKVTFVVDNNAEIWLNDEFKGTSSWTGNLAFGVYEIETRLPNYRPANITYEVKASKDSLLVRLDTPTPIYGGVDINSIPAMADIYVDGKIYGKTPQIIEQLLIGQHFLHLTRHGYADYNTTISINEGEMLNLEPTLKAINSNNYNFEDSVRIITVGIIRYKMIRVDGGTMQIGDSDNKSLGKATLSSFYIGETEVTQELWSAVMGKNPSKFYGNLLPVESVSWNDCQEFVREISNKTGLNFCLPSEEEWEFAARGGIKSRNYMYSGCNDLVELPKVAWFEENSAGLTHYVKVTQPNELGLYDMSGNVWEWCESSYDNYGADDKKKNERLPESEFRVNRGGGWNSNLGQLRTVFRNYNSVDFRSANLGMRLVLH